MKPIFLKELKLSRKSLIIWSVVMLATIGFGTAEYPFVTDNLEAVVPAIESMPRIIVIMFGMDGIGLQTPLEYYLVMYYWVVLIAFTHAAVTGVSIIGKEERDKTAEYLFTKPHDRNRFVTVKMLVAVTNAALLALVTWFANLAMMQLTTAMHTGETEGPVLGIIAVTMLGMFLTQLVFLSVGFLSAAYFRKYKTAVTASLAVVLVTYAVGVAIQYIGNISYLNFLSPFQYFNALVVVDEGIRMAYVLVAATVSAAAVYLAQVFYGRRDLMT